MLKQFSQL